VVAEPAAATRPARGRRPAATTLLLRQIRYQDKLFWRNPPSAFFGVAFPLVFLLLFNLLQGGERLAERGGIRYAQFLTPGIVAFAVISACYTNLATSVPINRDQGILKRSRGTPLPPWIYLAGRVGSAVWVALISALLLVATGVVLFQVEIVWRLLPAALLTLLVGAACFCACGLAVAALTPNGEAAPAVANLTILPLVFLSDVFYPLDQAPDWLQAITWAFPVKHFAVAMEADFSPLTSGNGLLWGHLAVLALWGVAASLLALRRFRWEPNEQAANGRRRRRGRRH
jgi:ABC-2 type transport system permease protein